MTKRVRTSLLFLLLVFFLPGCGLLNRAGIGGDGAGPSKLSKSMQELKAKYSKDSSYEIQEEVLKIEDDEPISFPTGVSKPADFESDGFGQSAQSSFEVYADSSLKTIMVSGFDMEDRKVLLQPGHNIVASQVSPAGLRDPFDLAEDKKSWGVFDTLYLLQRDDERTGKKLDKPKLWVVKINKKGRDKIGIKANAKVLSNGTLQLEWTDVPGAESYSIVKRKFTKRVDKEADAGSGFYQYEEIDRVESTVYRTEEPLDYNYETYHGGRSRTSEAAQRQENLRSYDAEYGGATADHVGDEQPYDLFVVPLKGHQPLGSMSNKISSDDFASRMPDQIAPTIFSDRVEAYNKSGQIPVRLPLQMMDGSIQEAPIVYDKIEMDRKWVHCTVSVEGLPSIKTDFDLENRTVESVQKGFEEYKQTQPAEGNTGVMDPDVSLEQADMDLDGKEVVRDVRDIEVRVNAATAAEEYFAKAIASGAEYVDYSAFPEVRFEDVLEVLRRVRFRNPTLPPYAGWEVDTDRQVVHFSYLGLDKEKNEEAQKKIKEVVQEVIKDGMSDREKVEALNQYIAEHGTYDDPAFETHKAWKALRDKSPLTEEEKEQKEQLQKDMEGKYASAWSITGILLEGKGVCESYARTFDALAKEAGLEAAYVSGYTEAIDNRHAWNLVKIDGEWLAVDVTWNDTDQDPNQYLLLPLNDARYAAEHHIDYEFKALLGLPEGG